MTPNQLPPLPDGVTLEDLLIPLRVALETCHDSDWSLRQFKTPISHALAALAQQAQECTRSHPHELMSPMCGLRTEIARLTNENERFKRAQQAQEPVAAALGDIVALWDKYAPSEYMTAIHMQAKRALAGQQPVSPDMHRWCAYVGGMVACWITSEPDAHARLGDDKFDAAIAGIIERRLWAMPTRDTTPPAPQVPAPVDERSDFEASMREKHGWVARDFQSDSFGYFDGHTANAWLAWQARAALQSPAPQTKGGEA